LKKKLFRGLSVLNPLRWLRRGWLELRNRLRRRAKIDYVVFTLSGTLPALPVERGFLQQRILGEPPISLVDLDQHFRRIGEDPRTKGVILFLRGLSMPLADLQTLRDAIFRLRGYGKHVVCYAQDYDLATYYVASAGDEIILQPTGNLLTLGLAQQAVFLKDALAQVGISFDAVAISPYKGAYDQLTRSEISPEGREQLEWLLDSRYDMIVNGIAEGRKVTPEAVRMMIDTAPHLDVTAQSAGYVDAVLNEESLPKYLQAEHLVPWEKAKRILLKQWRKPQRKHIALLEVSGLMTPGENQEPPIPIPVPLPIIGEQQAGDITIVQKIRRLMEDDDAAAVILFVDSPGGAVSAAEAMTAALEQLAKSRPLVVYMNGVAASGGYYIATASRWIVAQPGTITGSIGVLTGKPLTGGLFEKLHINRQDFYRGANVDLLSDLKPFSDDQRAIMRSMIERIYDVFTARVAAARGMSQSEVDAVAGGRVWTGLQARERGLVDELGGLQTALKKARELADLPKDAPLVIFRNREKTPLPPQLAKDLNPAAGLTYGVEAAKKILNGRAQMLLPFKVD
jgi:protease IV